MIFMGVLRAIGGFSTGNFNYYPDESRGLVFCSNSVLALLTHECQFATIRVISTIDIRVLMIYY